MTQPTMSTTDVTKSSTEMAATIKGPSLSKAVPGSFLDLHAQYSGIKNELNAAIQRVMESQHFILGAEVLEFEKELSEMIGATAVACASGSDALYLALLASEIGHGDEVITTPFTFVATAGAIARAGARPVFVDINPETFNIDPKLIAVAVTSKTKAIMPVHLFGLPADLDPILQIAKAHKLAVVEDAAQAIGSRYHGSMVGSLGTYGCFSFFPSKNLGGAGDGGLVTTKDPQLVDKLRLLRAHGSRKKYSYEIIGTNSRLDALQAAILRVKLKHLHQWTEGRRENARRYEDLFADFGLRDHVQWPADVTGRYHVYNQFTIRAKQRENLRAYLTAARIPTDIYYPNPLHTQPAFSYLGYREGDFPHAEAASREVLALPIYPELSAEAQTSIVQEISTFYKERVN